MKNSLLLFAIFCAFAVWAAAQQQITRSPFEGRWVWDRQGNDEPELSELFFFGNVMLGMEDDDPDCYEGDTFTFTSMSINIEGFDYELEYHLSGNILTITDEYDDSYSYRKADISKSPLEGIWIETGGTYFEPGEVYYILFFGDIMAEGDFLGFYGAKIEFNGRRFVFEDTVIEYRLSGNSLILVFDDEKIVLRKVY